MEGMSIGDRILVIKNKVGSTALSNASGLSTTQINRYIRGGSQPTIGPMVAMAECAGVSLEWLDTGEGPQAKHASFDNSSAPIADLNQVREPGAEYTTTKPDMPVFFTNAYLQRSLGLLPETSMVYVVENSDNAGGVKRGDVIVVDISAKSGNGLFVVNVSNDLQVLKLLFMPGGDLQISHGDGADSSYTLTEAQQKSIEVLGRVAWRGGKV